MPPRVSDALNQFHFEAQRSSQPYFLQGDRAFDASPLKKRRNEISRSAKVQSAALQFWSTAGLGAEQTMDRQTYFFVHRRISKALAPELSDAEAAEAAEEDWAEDAEGGQTITLAQYSQGLFGVADMWTDKVDELEYVVFLNKLFRRITALGDARGGRDGDVRTGAPPLPRRQ